MFKSKFNQYASYYDQTTPIQSEVARYLWHKIDPYQNFLSNHIWLDVGCGTGKLSQALFNDHDKNDNFHLIALDKSPAMLEQFCERLKQQPTFEQYANHITFLTADMTTIPLEKHSADMVISSFALHWVTPSVLNELARVSRVGGQIHLAIPVAGSLKKLHQRFPSIPIFPFLDASDWLTSIEKILQSRQGQWLYNEQLSFFHTYPNLLNLLKSLKNMGGATSGQSPMPTYVLKQYLADTQPIALNYEVLVVGFKV